MTQALENSIVTKVNVPYGHWLHAGALADALKAEKFATGQVYSFMTEIDHDQQTLFADHHKIDLQPLTESFTAIAG